MKKRLIMVMCCGIMILGNLSGCNAMKTKETEYHWPTSTHKYRFFHSIRFRRTVCRLYKCM